MAAPTPTGEELQVLAANHLSAAQVLRQAEHYSACWYLAGYSVECALKAIVCRTLRIEAYPDKIFRGNLKSHLFSELVILSGLSQELQLRQNEQAFSENWDLLTTWDPQDRYRTSRTEQQAEGILAALTNPQNGVFTWLSSQW